MKTFWICVFTILTLLGASCGSLNTNKEGYWLTWTWQNTFDLMITLWMLNYCAIALYLTFQYTNETTRLTRLQRHIELKRQREAQPKTWKRKPKRKQRKKQGEW